MPPPRCPVGGSTGRGPPSSRYSTAIRTLTPFATWSTMVLRSESATSEAISMPRTIGPGCMTTACSGQRRHPVGVEPVAAAVLPHGREEGGVHPLALDPQHHHDVALGQHRVEVVGDLGRPGLDPDRQQRRRRHQRDRRAERREQQHVRAGDPAVQDVADDRDAQPLEPAEPLAHGEGVQQRLRRVLVGAVAGVDHAAADPVRRADAGRRWPRAGPRRRRRPSPRASARCP